MYFKKKCPICGAKNDKERTACAECGAPFALGQVEGRVAQVSTEGKTQANVRLSRKRVGLACILSGGLYLFYWFYLTWKQLKEETQNPHYHPVRHALALLVPIYGWVIVVRHFKAIKELQDKAGLKVSLNVGRLLTLYVIFNALALQSAWGDYPSVLALTLNIIGVVLLAACLVSSQSSLNSYWEQVKGTQRTEARIGVAEVILVVVGLALWATNLL